MNEKRRHQEPPKVPPRAPTVCHCPDPMIDEDDTDEAPLCWRCHGVVLPPPEAA